MTTTRTGRPIEDERKASARLASLESGEAFGAGAAAGMEAPAMEAPAMEAPTSPPAAVPVARDGALGITVPQDAAGRASGASVTNGAAGTRWSSGASPLGAGAPSAATPQEWQRPERIATDFSDTRERYRVPVAEYVRFHEQGFLVVKSLLTSEEVEEIRQHSYDLLYGRVEVPGLQPPPPGTPPEEVERRYLRIHMLHRHLELHERYLLHPRVLDVVEALIGPDVLAMQTMFFIKAPGGAGQGYHQDSYYIPTYPDTLIGAWIAVDRADEENGCVWFMPGSQREPIYPTEERLRQNHSNLADLTVVRNVSHTDTEINTL